MVLAYDIVVVVIVIIVGILTIIIIVIALHRDRIVVAINIILINTILWIIPDIIIVVCVGIIKHLECSLRLRCL
jgi:hypothetical protein